MTTTLQAPPPFVFHAGTEPLLVSMPHMGTYIPPALASRLTDEARRVPDTDWHMDRLYAFAKDMGVSILMATHSRYVVDLNRPSDNTSLYPGQSVTGLCPLDTFDDTPLYREGMVADADEMSARVSTFWQPYHDQLRIELARLRQQHGIAMLWDAHSIRSVLPRFFEGKLPSRAGHHLVGHCSIDPGAQRGAQRALQGRLHHAPLWPTCRRHSCGATRVGPVQLHAGVRRV
jgi:N-formylglutamate deformylase